MTDNPLKARLPQSRGVVTPAMLDDYCEALNRCYFVKDSGKPYKIVDREIGGEWLRCLERAA